MRTNFGFRKASAVTPSDSVNLAPQGTSDGLTSALYVAAAGTVTVVFQDDSTCQFTAVAGSILPVAVKRVNSTGTAATGIVALYDY